MTEEKIAELIHPAANQSVADAKGEEKGPHAKRLGRPRGSVESKIQSFSGQGRTELHRAIAEQNYPLFNALVVRHDIDLNAQDRDGNTPMHLAVLSPVIKFVEDLVIRNVRIDLENNQHKTVIQLASDNVEKKGMTSLDDKKLKLLMKSDQQQQRAAKYAAKGGMGR